MGLILFVLYACGILMLGKWLEKGKTSECSFYLNNRSSSAAMVAFSIIASCVGASATIGTIGLAFSAGTPAFWWLGSGAVGLSILAIFLARKVQNSQAYTLPEMLENSLGPQVRRLISAIIVVAWISILAAQFVAISQIIQMLTGLTPFVSLASGALLITVHTLISGQSGIMKLDRIQCFVTIFGLLLLAFWLFQANPAGLASVKIQAVNEQFPPSRLFYFLLVLGGSYVVCPTLFGRLLSAKSNKSAQRGAWGAVIGLCFFSALIVLIGLSARGLIAPNTQPDQVLTSVLASTLPPWLTHIVYLTLLSVVISSADSCLITASLVLAGDFLPNKSVKHTRFCIAGIALAGVALTAMNKSILGFLLMANDVYVCGVVAPVFITIIVGKTKKAQPALMMTALILGGTLGTWSSISGESMFSYIGVSVSALLAALSFISAKPQVVSAGNS